MKELVARVRAVSRRGLRVEQVERGEPIEIEELRLDPREVQAYVDATPRRSRPPSSACSTPWRSTAAVSSPATS